jgi:hypothetical protein
LVHVQFSDETQCIGSKLASCHFAFVGAIPKVHQPGNSVRFFTIPVLEGDRSFKRRDHLHGKIAAVCSSLEDLRALLHGLDESAQKKFIKADERDWAFRGV